MPWKLPDINKCCGCVSDLRTAAAIIAVLGIVTSPAVSWAAVRHAYVIRVSCFITTSEHRADVVDINLNNVLSFGFGANAGLGPSCLGKLPAKPKVGADRSETTTPAPVAHSSVFVEIVKYFGWIVLIADMVFLFCSINFLLRIFHGPDTIAAKHFICAASTSIILSFLYGILYITACISIGGAFPFFEFVFCVVDLLIWFMWIYFILVIRCYIIQQQPTMVDEASANSTSFSHYLPYSFLKYLLLVPVWAYFIIVILSYKRRATGQTFQA